MGARAVSGLRANGSEPMKILASFLSSSMAGVCLLALPAPAHAGLADCGNINVEANATCEVQTGVECSLNCTPLKVEAACTAELYVDCSGECSASARSTARAVAGGLPRPCEIDQRAECRSECISKRKRSARATARHRQQGAVQASSKPLCGRVRRELQRRRQASARPRSGV